MWYINDESKDERGNYWDVYNDDPSEFRFYRIYDRYWAVELCNLLNEREKEDGKDNR